MPHTHEENHFFRATMRHFAHLRSSGPQAADSEQPFPADWFDLPQTTFADFGAMLYLAGLTSYHRPRRLDHLIATMEPALRLGQYKLFYSNGFPRAAITWAGLSSDAEYRFAIENRALEPQDWNSGTSTWLVDFIAPFGHVDQIVPMLTQNPSLTRLRTLFISEDSQRRRVVEWSRPSPDATIRFAAYGLGQFKKMLLEQGFAIGQGLN